MEDVFYMVQLNRNVKQKIIFIFMILIISSMGAGCDVNSMISAYLQKLKVYSNEKEISSFGLKDLTSAENTEDKIAKVGTYKQLLSILYSMNMIGNYNYSWKTTEDILTESGSSKPESNSGHSETNVQVSGVDEADLIKNDGNYIYYLNNGSLSIFDTSKEQPILVSKTEINNYDKMFYNMYLSGDTLVFCGGKYEVFHNRLDSSDSYTDYGKMIDAEYSIDTDYFYPYHFFTVFAVYDISDKKSPDLKRMVEVEGNEVSTRLIGDTLYFVTNKQISYISDYKVNDYEILPVYRDSAYSAETQVIQPADISYFPESKEAQYLLVGAFDITKDEEVKPQAYLGSGINIYMNTNSLYISKEVEQAQIDQDYLSSETMAFSLSTEIYRFAIQGMDIKYVGNERVSGSLINQYAMDEYKGVLRVASGSYSDGNGITTIDIDTMKPIASISGLAINERIYSVRFMGDVGYMVTYRNIDPLFVFDLSNPEKPFKTGELKIPGFSQYLHPVGDQYLVGFGRNTQEKFYEDRNGQKVPTGEVVDLGFKLSLFDVGDLYNPKEVFVKTYSEGTYSPASDDPHSIMADAENNIFAFPIDNGWSDDRKSGTVVKINPSTGFTTLTDVDSLTMNIHEARFCYTKDKLYFLTENRIAVYSYPECKLINSMEY